MQTTPSTNPAQSKILRPLAAAQMSAGFWDRAVDCAHRVEPGRVLFSPRPFFSEAPGCVALVRILILRLIRALGHSPKSERRLRSGTTQKNCRLICAVMLADSVNVRHPGSNLRHAVLQ